MTAFTLMVGDSNYPVGSRDDLLAVCHELAAESVAKHPQLFGLLGDDAVDAEKVRTAASREAIDITNGLWAKPTPVWHRSRTHGEVCLVQG